MNGVPAAVDRLALSRERLRLALRVSSASRRAPLGLVVGAVALAGVVAWMRPWRWVPKSVLFAGLLPKIVLQIVSGLPPRLWMNVLTSLARGWRAPAASSPVTGARKVSRAPVSAPAVRKM